MADAEVGFVGRDGLGEGEGDSVGETGVIVGEAVGVNVGRDSDGSGG